VKPKGAAVGVVENANTVVLVTVGPDGALLDRRTVVLTPGGTPTHPHHHEGSWAVGRYLETPGARAMPMAEAVKLVEQVKAAAEQGAREALEALARAVAQPIGRIALRECPVLPPSIEERIRDNRAQSTADSVMYRQALARAAEARGWSVHWYDRVTAGRGTESKAVVAMGKAAGTPWQAKHKLAAAAALSTL
jgi:hypothetical protein